MTGDLVSYVSRRDLEIVLDRVPHEYRTRLRDVFLSWRSSGVRRLGWVRRSGRRDVNLIGMLPPRVSLRRFIVAGQSPSEFGAPARGQWPPWAVRRFLLYDVFLHEIGHLQLVNPKGRTVDRRFASETKAQEFADELRRTLFSKRFDHGDPVHNAPSNLEQGIIPAWERMDKDLRYKLVRLVLAAPHDHIPDLNELGELTQSQRWFLAQVCCHYEWTPADLNDTQ